MKLNYTLLTLFLLFCGIVFSVSVPVRECNDIIPTALYFTSEGCVTPPCPLIKGSPSNANITFKIPRDTETSTIKIRAQLLGQNWWIPYPAPDKNVCHNLINSYCPLDENEVVTFHLAIAVLSIYPAGLNLDLEVSFLDGKNTTMMCMQIKCKVVDP